MPPTRLFVNRGLILGVQFTLGSAMHTCEEAVEIILA